MTRTRRGVWARRGTLFPLLLLTMVVVAGVVAVIGFADGADTSAAVAVPLLLLGIVAVPATGRQLATVRRREIALARLRGITGGQLFAVLAVEPLLVLVAGSLLGVVLGAAVAWVAGRTWIDTGTSALEVTVLPWVAGIVVVGLVAVLVGMAGALREPLSEQVSIAERPRPASTTALFVSVLLLVAAGVAVYRSAVAPEQDADWVVLAGPALVGLAVGQVAVWLIRLAARLAVGATSGRGLPGFLASRRLARVAEAATPIRLVVAAAVVGAVSVTGAQQVDDWSDDTARLRAGAAIQVPVDGDVYDALALSHELDPDGEWLMAAALVPGTGSVPARRVFVDTERYAAVAGDFLAGTPSAGVADHVADLTTGEGVSLASGDTVTVAARGVSRRLTGDLNPRVTITYGNDRGETSTVNLDLSLDPSGAPDGASARLDDCAGGCLVSGLRLHRAAGDAVLPWVLTTLDFAGGDALAGTWRSTSPGAFGVAGGPRTVDDGLLVLGAEVAQTAVPESSGPRTPVLATDSATWPDGPPLLDSPGGDERPAAVVDRLPALPLVEADGVLADLPLAASGAPPTVPAAEVMVLAAADIPVGVLDALVEQTGADPRTFAEIGATTAREVGALQARVYALVALFCFAVALLVVAASIARQREVYQREVAALRVVGVDLPTLRRSGRVEIGALTLGAVVAAVAGGVAAVHLLLKNLSLVTEPLHAVPLRIGVDALPILGSAVVVAVLVVAVSGRGRAVRSGAGRPAILREEAST